MNNKEREKELNNKIKEIERLNKDILDMYQRYNKNLLELSNGLHGSLQGILEFTKNKPIGSDLYNIHIFAGEGLETYRKVYANSRLYTAEMVCTAAETENIKE